jgi:hypothetical protein
MAFPELIALGHLFPQYFFNVFLKLCYVKNKVPEQNCCGFLAIIAVSEMLDFGNKEMMNLDLKKNSALDQMQLRFKPLSEVFYLWYSVPKEM